MLLNERQDMRVRDADEVGNANLERLVIAPDAAMAMH